MCTPCLKELAFEALPHAAFKKLYKRRDICRALAPRFNKAEYRELYNYRDVNTALFFALRHNLHNIAERAIADGGEISLIQNHNIRHRISNRVADIILEHCDINDYNNLLTYNAVAYGNKRLCSKLHIELCRETNYFTTFMATIRRGDIELLRRIMRKYLHSHSIDNLRHYLYSALEIGECGKWEMYEFVCETMFGKGVKFAKNCSKMAYTINHAFIFGALIGGHADLVRRFLDDERIGFTFSRAEYPRHYTLIGASEYWRLTYIELYDELIARNFDTEFFDHVVADAISHRNLEAVEYFVEKFKFPIYSSNIFLHYAIRSHSTTMVKYLGVKYISPDVAQTAMNDFGVFQNNIRIIRTLLRFGAVIRSETIDQIPTDQLKSNTLSFIFEQYSQHEDSRVIKNVYPTLKRYISEMRIFNRDTYKLFYAIVFSKIPNARIKWEDVVKIFAKSNHHIISNRHIDILVDEMGMPKTILKKIYLNSLDEEMRKYIARRLEE